MKLPPSYSRLYRSYRTKLRSRVLVMTVLATFLHFSASGSHASMITVNSGADAGGICPGPTCTLRQAITTAVSGDAIDFANGLMTIDLTSAELLINKDLTLYGPGATLLSVQRTNTNANFRIFNIASGHVSISGLTVAGGKSEGSNGSASGAGILNQTNGILLLTECAVSDNSANAGIGIAFGGGINNAGVLILDRSTVYGNGSSGDHAFGGGIYNTGTLNIIGSTISDNTTGSPFSYGGGLYNASGTVSISNSTLRGNSNPGGEGGAINNNGVLTITDSTLSNNSVVGGHGGASGMGGALFNTGQSTITRCTLNGNKSGNVGSAIFNSGTVDLGNTTVSANIASGGSAASIYNSGTTNLINCTVAGNSADGTVGGVYNYSGTVKARNTIIAGNTIGTPCCTGPDFYGTLTSQGYNLIGNSNGATITPMPGDQIGTAASPIDPGLGPLQDNGGPTLTCILLPGSPAIDRGGTATGLTTDQRGKRRPVDDPSMPNAAGGDGSDIGAVELSPIQFNAAGYSVRENAGSFALAVSRNGDTSQPATVHYATSDGTATAGSDYNSASGDLTFAPGETEKTITLQILDDSFYEGDETFSVTLSSPVGGDLGLSVTVITIVAPPARSVNISTRARVQTGDNVMIGGFIITGNVPKPVVLRGLGPSLVAAGVPSDTVLNDPVLELHGASGALIISNDNWKDSPQRAQIEGTAFQPMDDREAVILATLPPAAYTAVVRGNDSGSGVGLMEIYDKDQNSDSTLANISTRALVGTGNDVVIGGFILGGADGNPTIIVRAIGPSLAQLGINDPLADPTLELRDGNGALMIFDDNWKDDSAQQQQISAAGLQPADDLEAAIAATLPPGTYTAIVASKDGSTGVGLVEIYNLKN